MKLAILCFLAALAVARSSYVDEDETAVILRSPYHQHAADFLSQFKSYLGSRPTGRPLSNLYKDVHDRYRAAMKALAAQRPTGRPFRNHKDRSNHNHATWQLHNNYRKAQSALRKYAYQKYQAQRAAASAARKAADETELVSSPFGAHVDVFKQHADELLAHRPTGRPVVHNLLKDLHQKYNEAKKKLKAGKHGKHSSKEDKKSYKKAYDALKDHKKDAEHKIKAWKHDQHKHKHANDDADEVEIIASSFADHAKGFRQQVADLFAHRPTGRPDFDGFMKTIQQKYQEAKDRLKAASKAGKMTDEKKKALKKARKTLENHMDDAEDKVDDWKDMLKKEKLNAKFAASPLLASHVDGFKQHADGLLGQRPTGRPVISSLLASLHKKYNEAKEALKAGTKSGSKQDKQLYDHAKDMLKDHRDDVEDQLEDWDDQLKDEAKQARVAASAFGPHVDEFKGHLAGLLNPRPTGRPGIASMFKSMHQKYQEVKNKINANRPGKGASKDDRKAYNQAKDVLEDHRDDAADKLKAWRKQILKSLTQQ